MATVHTESGRAAAFILMEASGQRSRDNATLAAGQNLVAGTVLALDSSATPDNKVYTAYNGSRDSGALPDPYPVAILIYDVDATAAAKAVSVITRDCEVNLKVLTYPTQAEEEADMIRLLALVGIICRT